MLAEIMERKRVATGVASKALARAVAAGDWSAASSLLRTINAQDNEIAKLYGLHAPERHQHQVAVATADKFDALVALADRQAETLLAAKLDRISRSLADAVDLDRTAAKQGWRITTADQMVDTTTPAGRASMNMLRVFSEFERDMISQRTREALAERASSSAHPRSSPTPRSSASAGPRMAVSRCAPSPPPSNTTAC
ncbi:recombinase family protein [Gordonia sp. NPDC003425]